MKKLIIAAVIIAAIGLSPLYFPGVHVFTRAREIQSVSPYCSMWKGALDYPVRVRRHKLAEDIAQNTKLIRTDGEQRLWSTPHGDYWVPSETPWLLSVLIAQQESGIYGDADTGGVRAGDTVFDCGAHVGVYARYALKAGARRVIAIEPTPSAVTALERNLASEIADGRVIIVPKGIWGSEGELTFYRNGNAEAGNSFINANRDAQRIVVPVTTIDAITSGYSLGRVDLIKADIKGAVEQMLRGASTVIRRDRPRLTISTEEAPDDPAAITRLVHSMVPEYSVRCGPCIADGTEIRTDVMFYQHQ